MVWLVGAMGQWLGSRGCRDGRAPGIWNARRSGLVGFVGLILAGCAEQATNLQPAQILALLQAGRPVLDCRDACLAQWRRVQPTAARLDADASWNDLAVLLAHTRYQDDLTLYYLGRSAQGMGFYQAARSYYRQSMQLSGTSISCQNLSGLCGGVALPNAVLRRLAEIDRAVAPPKPRILRPQSGTSPIPGAPAAGGDTGASEYIEPPPAKR